MHLPTCIPAQQVQHQPQVVERGEVAVVQRQRGQVPVNRAAKVATPSVHHLTVG